LVTWLQFEEVTMGARDGTAACPMSAVLRLLMGPWTAYIVWNLRSNGAMRFGELKRAVAGVSAKVLTERLRHLEEAGLVSRHYQPTIPPQVTYSLTRRGRELEEVLDALNKIGCRWAREDAKKRAA
jgi:DNA-binding HxlR family transcriptional regulator